MRRDMRSSLPWIFAAYGCGVGYALMATRTDYVILFSHSIGSENKSKRFIKLS